MEAIQTLKNSVLETFGLASSVNAMQKNKFIDAQLFQNFRDFALVSIEQGIVYLRKMYEDLDNLPSVQLANNLYALQLYIGFFDTIKEEISKTELDNLYEFSTVLATYYQLLLSIETLLEQKLEFHFCYLASHAVLADDWNNPENDCWDNC
jgi:hypothetical protein